MWAVRSNERVEDGRKSLVKSSWEKGEAEPGPKE